MHKADERWKIWNCRHIVATLCLCAFVPLELCHCVSLFLQRKATRPCRTNLALRRGDGHCCSAREDPGFKQKLWNPPLIYTSAVRPCPAWSVGRAFATLPPANYYH